MAQKIFTLEKVSPTKGGTYTDIIEFVIDDQANKAIISKACAWNRVLNGEQDNGSDLFGQETRSVEYARTEYKLHQKLGYKPTDACYYIADGGF